jgi:hypothetical protein
MMRFHTSSRKTSLLAQICCLLVLAPIASMRVAPVAFIPAALQTWGVGTESESNSPIEEECEAEAIAHPRCLRRWVEAHTAWLTRSSSSFAAVQAAICSTSETARSRVVSEQQLKNGVGSPLRC